MAHRQVHAVHPRAGGSEACEATGVCSFVIAGAFAGVAGALSAPLYFSPPGTLQYISFNSLFYVSIPILAGFDSLTAVVGVAVVFTLLPLILLEAKINVFLIGGVGLSVGVLLGPRGISGVIGDCCRGPRGTSTAR